MIYTCFLDEWNQIKKFQSFSNFHQNRILRPNSRKAQSQTRQILCHGKKFYYRTVKSLRTGPSCGKIDAGVFKQFWNLSGLSLGHNQLEIIYERQKMMLTRRNWIYIETDLAKTGGMAGAPDEHAEVSRKSGLGTFLSSCLFHADICFISENYDH